MEVPFWEMDKQVPTHTAGVQQAWERPQCIARKAKQNIVKGEAKGCHQWVAVFSERSSSRVQECSGGPQGTKANSFLFKKLEI